MLKAMTPPRISRLSAVVGSAGVAVAAALTEEFGYSGLELTARELGAGLIIEAGINP